MSATLTIKRYILIEKTEAYQLEVYCASSALGKRIGQLSPKAHLYLDILEDYLNGAIVQYQRILASQGVGRAISIAEYKQQESKARLESKFFRAHIAINDVHFYTICVDKIDKLYPKIFSELARIHSKVGSSTEVKNKKSLAVNLLRHALAPAVKARQYLEHLDKEMALGNFRGLGIETNLTGSTFSFGLQKQRLALGDLGEIRRAYEALISYIDAVCNVSLP